MTTANPEARACSRESGPDCKWLIPYISWWCTNEACCKSRGTQIPGVIGCPFYKPSRGIGRWLRRLL